MPVFEYSCTQCGLRFEKILKKDTSQPMDCPSCSSKEVKKELSAFSSPGGSSTESACFSGG